MMPPSLKAASDPRLLFRGVDTQASSIRELSPDIPLSVVKKAIASDGYDQVIFELEGKRFIASGDGLNLRGIHKSDLPAQDVGLRTRITDALTLSRRLNVTAPTEIEAQFLGQTRTLTLLAIDNETNTAREGAGLSVLAAGGTLAFSNVTGALSARYAAGPPLKALGKEALNAQKLLPRLKGKWTILQHDGVQWGARQFQRVPGIKGRNALGVAAVVATVGVVSLAVGASVGAVGAKMRGEDDEALLDMSREISGPTLMELAQSQAVGLPPAQFSEK